MSRRAKVINKQWADMDAGDRYMNAHYGEIGVNDGQAIAYASALYHIAQRIKKTEQDDRWDLRVLQAVDFVQTRLGPGHRPRQDLRILQDTSDVLMQRAREAVLSGDASWLQSFANACEQVHRYVNGKMRDTVRAFVLWAASGHGRQSMLDRMTLAELRREAERLGIRTSARQLRRVLKEFGLRCLPGQPGAPKGKPHRRAMLRVVRARRKIGTKEN